MLHRSLFMFAAFLGGAVVTFAVTPLIALFSRRRGIVDLPGGRKGHAEPTPRMGGIAVFVGLILGASVYALAFGWDAFARLLRGQDHAALFLACAIVLFVGVIDDWRGLVPVVRVLFEAMAAVILIQVGYLIDAVWTPWGVVELGLFAYPLTVLWIVAVTNSFNLIDGLDGLLPSVGIASLLGVAGVGLLVGMKGTVFLPLALAGALAGFLYWNWRPARVFLGDSGSLVVGFLAAAMALKVSRYIAGGVALHVMLALCAVPVVETLLTLARRYVGGQPYFSGDQSHALSDDIVVLDSGSTDRTVEIAKAFGARVVTRPFDDERIHRTYSLRGIEFRHPWVYNPDADEVTPPDLRDEMLDLAADASRPEVAYRVRFKTMFMGRWIKHASMYPTWVMRLFRPEKIRLERSINLTYLADGPVGRLRSHFLHCSFGSGLSAWREKHLRYASIEAEETLKDLRDGRVDWAGLVSHADPVRRRRALKSFSFRLPCPPLLRFLYMFFIRRGFLDGWPGFRYCRLLAGYEAMIVEKTREFRSRGAPVSTDLPVPRR